MRAASTYFGLVLILSLPFYVIGLTGAALPFAQALPLSALMAMLPMLAALGLVARQGGLAAAWTLFTAAFATPTRANAWWVVLALATMPVAFALTAGMVWLSGETLPALHLSPASVALAALALFFLGAVTEEIGWQGYAFPHLHARFPALTAALIIGVVWALWHVIPFALTGRSAAWIVWQGAGMVLMRIIMVWLVLNAGGRVLTAVLFHMNSNSVWGVFTDFTVYYEPMFMFVVLAIFVAAVLSSPSAVLFRRATVDRKSTP